MMWTNSKSGLRAANHRVLLASFDQSHCGRSPIARNFFAAAIAHTANLCPQANLLRTLRDAVEKIYSLGRQGPDACMTTRRRQWAWWL